MVKDKLTLNFMAAKGIDLMTKSSKKVKSKASSVSEPWIKMTTGKKIIAAASVAMAVITGLTTVPALGWLEGLAWALGFGVMVWALFYGLLYAQKFLHK